MTVALTQDQPAGRVRRISRFDPSLLLWLALIAVLVFLRGFRADIGESMREVGFMIPLAGAWLTGATAALAASEAP